MKFIDSNILAYAFYENPFQELCQKQIKEGGYTDTLTLIEAFNIIELQTKREIATSSIKGLLKSNLKIIDIDLNLIFEALKRSDTYKKLNFLDLIHYTSALLHHCEIIVTYDKDFNGLELKRNEPA